MILPESIMNGVTIETHCYRLSVVNQNETKLVKFLVSQNAISLLLINGVKFCMRDFVR